MIRSVLTALVFAILPVTFVGATALPPRQVPAPGPSDFVLHFNQVVDPSALVVSYLNRRTSAPGNTSSSPGTRLTWASPRDVFFSTLRDGQDANAVRVVVFCRDFRFAVIDVPVLTPETRRQTVTLQPLATLPLHGRVVLPAGVDATGITLEVGYDVNRLLLDVFFPDPFGRSLSWGPRSFPVASTTLTSDGSFELRVPDFMSDPIAAAHPGRFNSFEVRLRGPWGPYSLVWPPSEARWSDGIALARSYDQPIVVNFRDR